ncbi:MAG: hypothetical protein FJ044_05795, partial [Candidatus Cloacimonetes bacterium]|nr:hypothetical protein [Candidatus Cloacimonadota bacterium]
MVNEISATPGGAEQSEQTVKTEELDWGREIERDKEFTNEAIAVANQTVGKAEQRAKEVEVNVTKEAQTAQEKLDKIEAEIFERERPAQEEIERIERQIIIPEGLEFVSDTESGGQIKNEVGPRYPKTRFFEGGLTHEIETVKPEAEIVPNLTHPELFDLPIAGWPETREQLVFRGGYLLDALVKVVTHEETPEKKLFGTKAAGRAGFLE